jgi:hypothetical protein
MALNVYTPFTADRSILAGGQALGAGIGGGLASVGDALAKALERKQREGKISEQLGKLLETAYPERADEFKTWSLPQKQGFLEGEALKSAQRKEGIEMERLLGDIQDQIEARADRARNRALPGAMRQLLEAPLAIGTGPLSNEAFDARVSSASGISPGALALLRAAEQSGAPIPPSVLDDLIRGGREEEAPFFQPSQASRALPLIGPDGAAIPGMFQVPVGPRASQIITDPTQPQRPGQPLQPRVTVGQNPLTGEPQVTWSGSPEDFEQAFPHLAKPGGAKPSAAKPAAQFKKGDRVKQDNVLYEFDGKEWKPVP